MHMLYNSPSYAVVVFEPAEAAAGPAAGPAVAGRGGYEIVDKFAGKEIYISGVLAESFRSGVQALIDSSPSEEEIDDYLGRFSALMHQPVVMH